MLASSLIGRFNSVVSPLTPQDTTSRARAGEILSAICKPVTPCSYSRTEPSGNVILTIIQIDFYLIEHKGSANQINNKIKSCFFTEKHFAPFMRKRRKLFESIFLFSARFDHTVSIINTQLTGLTKISHTFDFIVSFKSSYTSIIISLCQIRIYL